jgi:hypothetical protein
VCDEWTNRFLDGFGRLAGAFDFAHRGLGGLLCYVKLLGQLLETSKGFIFFMVGRRDEIIG